MTGKNDFKVDFIGVGVPKAATTWITDCLDKHPDICMSEPKEVRYFDENKEKKLSWYKKHFIHCKKGQIKGEFSTKYLYDSDAPRLIKKFFPEVKIIICLRNPVDRAYSEYWMAREYYSYKPNDTFENLLKEGCFIRSGMYYTYIKNYLRYFSGDKIHIILLEDIKSSPKNVLKELLDFLNVDSDIAHSLIKGKSNTSKKIRYRSFIEILRFLSKTLIDLRLNFLIKFLKKIGLKKLLLKLTTVPYKYPEMNPETRKGFKKIFREDIERLEKLIDRDLSRWK
ncbi:sulfotransferase domain-containing protein [Candidatus Peregrinibacteria bacterium]|nr:sulfotransferase domain-containing protein [Candidatus Peregrinibacteria bacterium]